MKFKSSDVEKRPRPYKPGDCREIVKLFYDTVHTVNSKDYSPAQLDVWAPEEIDLEIWEKSLSNNHNFVVESGGIIVGFGDLDNSGYFDRLFVHKDFQGQGIATVIADELEKCAQKKGLKVITTESSITARPFFEKRGYRVIREKRVERKGQTLTSTSIPKYRYKSKH